MQKELKSNLNYMININIDKETSVGKNKILGLIDQNYLRNVILCCYVPAKLRSYLFALRSYQRLIKDTLY